MEEPLSDIKTTLPSVFCFICAVALGIRFVGYGRKVNAEVRLLQATIHHEQHARFAFPVFTKKLL